MSNPTTEFRETLSRRIDQLVFGAAAASDALAIALIARGHVLVQGVPGVGKTLLARTLAAQLGGRARRIQCTPDLMPPDILGVHLYRGPGTDFEFVPGPLFAEVVLIDEINRTGPKTQSALLEAMEEGRVTVDRDSYPLPDRFLVIATQNPHEFEGTFPLPESQLDRFLLRIDMTYPDRDSELSVLQAYGTPDAPRPDPAAMDPLPAEQLSAARQAAAAVHVSPAIQGYVLDLARASRERERISLGLSTRGALALLRCARIRAALDGAEYVTPEHVKKVAVAVMAHRLALTTDAELEGMTTTQAVADLLGSVAVPR